jgi:hypothetical protein
MNYSIASGNESAETGDPGRTSIHPSVLLSYIVSSVLPDMSSCFPCSRAADSEEEGGARDRSQYEEVPELGSYGGPQEDHAAEPPAEANSSSGEEPQKAKAAIPHTSPASSPKETV